MDETFVPNLLRGELVLREEKLGKLSEEIHRLRDKIANTHDKNSSFDVYWLRKELETYESARRELRGQVSALRQAISKLEKED